MGYASAAADDASKDKCRIGLCLNEIEPEDATALVADLDNPAVGDSTIHRRLMASRIENAIIVGVKSVRKHRQGTCTCQ